MEILVNQEPLSFSLESEEYLGEIIDGIADWLREGRFAITAINVDDNSVPIHDRTEWQDMTVSSVDRLSLEAFPLSHVEQTTLAAIGDYCQLLSRAMSDRNETAVRELAEELPYVRDRLDQLFPGLIAADPSDGILSDSALDQGNLPHPEVRSRLALQLQNIGTIVESRLREFENPLRELSLTLGQLVGCSDPLVQVPVQLQTGNESGAMSTVVLFAEYLTRIIRLLPLVAASDQSGTLDTEAIGQFALDLTPFLHQLQEAFEVQDGVLIGDLLEYEIAPRLAGLPSLLPADHTRHEESSER